MDGKTEFLEKLNGLRKKAKEQGNRITTEEVKAYFSEDALTEEQIALVFDYLLAQKVAVQGYLKMDSKEEEQEMLSEEERGYLKAYLSDLETIRPADKEELPALFAQAAARESGAKARLTEIYLKEVVEVAKELHIPEVFLGDLIQEGNLGLMLGVEMLGDAGMERTTEGKDSDADAFHSLLMTQIRQSMQMLLEEQKELHHKDQKMVEKVEMLDRSIRELTEELGRKVTMDELAVHMGMEIQEIEDILKLAGEDSESEEEET